MFFYEPTYNAQGARIPRWALEGMHGLGEADASLDLVLSNLGKQAADARSIVIALSDKIATDTVTQSDMDRARLTVIKTSQDIGSYMAIIPETLVGAIQSGRKALLSEYAVIEKNWEANQTEARIAANRVGAVLKVLSADLATSAVKLADATRKAAAAVQSGAVDASEAAGSVLKNLGAGLTSGFGWILIPGIAVIGLLAVAYMKGPGRAKNPCYGLGGGSKRCRNPKHRARQQRRYARTHELAWGAGR